MSKNNVNDDEIYKTNIDKTVLDFLDRDFRIEPKFKSKALQFADFTKFCQDFPRVVPVEEYARSISSSKNGVSVRTMIRLLARFSGADMATQRKVIELLLSNDKHVQPYVIFKHNTLEDSYELDVDAIYFS